VLVGLAWANAVAILVLWLRAGGVGEVHSGSDALTSAGRLTALLGSYLALLAILLLARVPLLERHVGFDHLTIWHRHAARGCLVLLGAHVVLTVAGLTAGDRVSLPEEIGRLISQYPGVITATAGFVLLVAVAISSAVAVRPRLRYESWYAVHLYGYLAIALAYSHQIATGKDFVGAPGARAYWIALYLVTLGALVAFRVLRPLLLAARHRLRVMRVVEEVPGVVSIEIRGRQLERLRARPGQFFLWRFLTPEHWGQAHPFSLSAAPDGERLRITVGASGDFSAGLGSLRPGTPVLAEGPLGVFTADASRRGRVALIAGGIGITPIRALLESIGGEVELVYRPREGSRVLFAGELDALAAARGVRVHYVEPSERELSAELLEQLVPDIAERDVFVSGSPAMVQSTRSSLIEAGVGARHIFIERFAL
jgi:predicted ferric reductase